LIQIDVHLIFTKLILKLFPYSKENDKFDATFVPSTIYDMNLPFNIQMKRIMADLQAVQKTKVVWAQRHRSIPGKK
jgi:hypothetical protein